MIAARFGAWDAILLAFLASKGGIHCLNGSVNRWVDVLTSTDLYL